MVCAVLARSPALFFVRPHPLPRPVPAHLPHPRPHRSGRRPLARPGPPPAATISVPSKPSLWRAVGSGGGGWPTGRWRRWANCGGGGGEPDLRGNSSTATSAIGSVLKRFVKPAARARPWQSSSCSFSLWRGCSPTARTTATRPASPFRSTPTRSGPSTTPGSWQREHSVDWFQSRGSPSAPEQARRCNSQEIGGENRCNKENGISAAG